MELLVSLAERASKDAAAEALPVLAIIRLAESRRSWFVTAVRRRLASVEVVGYSPGCAHASGRWFRLEPAFFDLAAAKSGDRLVVEVLGSPVPLDMMEDDCL